MYSFYIRIFSTEFLVTYQCAKGETHNSFVHAFIM